MWNKTFETFLNVFLKFRDFDYFTERGLSKEFQQMKFAYFEKERQSKVFNQHIFNVKLLNFHLLINFNKTIFLNKTYSYKSQCQSQYLIDHIHHCLQISIVNFIKYRQSRTAHQRKK
jgi:hypothetical protein